MVWIWIGVVLIAKSNVIYPPFEWVEPSCVKVFKSTTEPHNVWYHLLAKKD